MKCPLRYIAVVLSPKPFSPYLLRWDSNNATATRGQEPDRAKLDVSFEYITLSCDAAVLAPDQPGCELAGSEGNKHGGHDAGEKMSLSLVLVQRFTT